MIGILKIDSAEVQNALRKRREWMQKRGLTITDGKEYSGNFKGTSSKRKREILSKLDQIREQIDKL